MSRRMNIYNIYVCVYNIHASNLARVRNHQKHHVTEEYFKDLIISSLRMISDRFQSIEKYHPPQALNHSLDAQQEFQLFHPVIESIRLIYKAIKEYSKALSRSSAVFSRRHCKKLVSKKTQVHPTSTTNPHQPSLFISTQSPCLSILDNY